jgi:hypothetical protein|tara:strand:+ start:4952 stop:5158 length:207 start_codon:yes stop_codon:yes gene_type:complete
MRYMTVSPRFDSGAEETTVEEWLGMCEECFGYRPELHSLGTPNLFVVEWNDAGELVESELVLELIGDE